MNKKAANILFGIFILFSLISFCWSFNVHKSEIEIPLLGHINSDIRLNIEADKDVYKNLNVLFNGEIQAPYFMKASPLYATYEINNIPLYNIALVFDNDKAVNKINNIVLTNGYKLFYFNKEDVLKFNNKNNIYIFPDTVKFDKNSSYINDKGPFKAFSFGVLSIFYNMKFYIIPILWFLFAILIYLNNKEKINLGFNFFKNTAIWWILGFASIVRLTDAKFSFWDDELFTACVAGAPDASIKSIFIDPINPPFFHLCAKIWGTIFPQEEQILRILPCIFSIISIFALYYLVKKFLDKKTALIASFLMTINVYSIHSAQEYRSYALCILFAVLSTYLLFEIVKNQKNKDFILYGIIASLMANTHYYQIIILFGNFIFGNIFLDKKGKIKFFLTHLFGVLAFLPFFVKVAMGGGLLNKDYYGPVKPAFYNMVDIYSKLFCSKFLSVLILFILILFLIPKVRNYIFESNKKEFFNLYFYSLFIVIFVFIFSYIFSQVRSIVRPYYFVNLLPYVVILTALTILLPLKNKICKILFSSFLILIYFNFGSYIKRVGYATFQNLFEYSFYDSAKHLTENKIFGIAIHENIEFKNFYLQFIKDDEQYVLYKYNQNAPELINIIKNSTPDIVYIRLESKQYYKIAKELEKNADVGLIRTNNDVIIARIVKK